MMNPVLETVCEALAVLTEGIGEPTYQTFNGESVTALPEVAFSWNGCVDEKPLVANPLPKTTVSAQFMYALDYNTSTPCVIVIYTTRVGDTHVKIGTWRREDLLDNPAADALVNILDSLIPSQVREQLDAYMIDNDPDIMLG